MSDYQSATFTTPPTGAEAPPQENQGQVERPEWLPENFKSPEDLAKSYKELQAELTRVKQGQPKAPDNPPAEAPKDTEAPKQDSLTIDEQAQAAVEDAGLDMAALTQEWATSGTLSEASYEKLTKVGFPRELVDDYIRLKSSEATNIVTDIKASVGGDQAFTEMVSWARTNWTADQLRAYNEGVNSGDPAKMRLAVQALNADFRANNTSVPRLVSGGNGPVSAGGYRSQAEFLADIQNPKYREDPAFRADVEQRLARSSIF
jgi:hypothetical protein